MGGRRAPSGTTSASAEAPPPVAALSRFAPFLLLRLGRAVCMCIGGEDFSAAGYSSDAGFVSWVFCGNVCLNFPPCAVFRGRIRTGGALRGLSVTTCRRMVFSGEGQCDLRLFVCLYEDRRLLVVLVYLIDGTYEISF